MLAMRGQPSRKVSDGSGGKIWVYEKTITDSTPATVETRNSEYGNFDGIARFDQSSSSSLNAQYSGYNYSHGTSVTTFRPATTTKRIVTRSFYVNRSGVIYAVAGQGFY